MPYLQSGYRSSCSVVRCHSNTGRHLVGIVEREGRCSIFSRLLFCGSASLFIISNDEANRYLKVIRIIMATFSNILRKVEEREIKKEAALQMVQCKTLKTLELMDAKKYDDTELEVSTFYSGFVGLILFSHIGQCFFVLFYMQKRVAM